MKNKECRKRLIITLNKRVLSADDAIQLAKFHTVIMFLNSHLDDPLMVKHFDDPKDPKAVYYDSDYIAEKTGLQPDEVLSVFHFVLSAKPVYGVGERGI